MYLYLIPSILGMTALLVYEIFQSEWESVAKIWGPLGVICLLLVLAIWKGLAPYIKKQGEDNKEILLSVVEDARKERDYLRTLREKEVDKFIESSRLRDQAMKESLEGVARAIREVHERK